MKNIHLDVIGLNLNIISIQNKGETIMKRIEYNHNKIEGPDTCIEISLKEYGFAWIEGEEDILFYYGIKFDDHRYNRFNFCSFDKNTDIKKEFDWVEWDDINDYTDMDIMDLSFPNQIFDLYMYYGYQNVFGESYASGLKYSDIITEE